MCCHYTTTGNSVDEEQKIILDFIHMKKIEASDVVFVLDVGRYIGESTKREVALARAIDKEIVFLIKEYPEWTENDCIWTK